MAQAQVILALDPGHKKTGVAIGNKLSRTARPLETVTGDLDAQVQKIQALCEQWRPGLLLIGLPEEAIAKRASRYSKKLGDALEKAIGIEICFADEAYTTQIARSEDPKGDIDATAAAVLASDWLNAN